MPQLKTLFGGGIFADSVKSQHEETVAEKKETRCLLKARQLTIVLQHSSPAEMYVQALW